MRRLPSWRLVTSLALVAACGKPATSRRTRPADQAARGGARGARPARRRS